MNKKEIENLSEEEIDEELFREINSSWERKDLISHIINNLFKEEKIRWIKEWFEG